MGDLARLARTRMSVFDTNTARVCVVYVVAYVVLKVLRVMSTVAVMVLGVCLPASSDSAGDSEVRSVMPIVGDLVLSVSTCVTAFVVQTASSVVYSMYIIYPFLILSLMLSVFHDQYDVVMEMVVSSYNRFVSKNAMVVFLRHTLWFAKLSWEMVLPLYNYLVHVVSGVNVEVFKALFFDDNTIEVLFSVFAGVGVACVELARALMAWVNKDIFDCRYDAIAADMNVLSTHECMQFGPGKHRSLELGPMVLMLQTAVSQGTLLVATMCPAVTSFTTALVYPVYDVHMQDIVENAANLVLGCAWTVWDVTHTRCRFAMARGLPSTLCVPDVAPLFHFAHQIALDVGELVDNWVNIVNVVVMRFFMDRAPGFCAQGQYDMKAIAAEPVFGAATTRLVALTDNLLAMTDGMSVVFANANDQDSNQRRENAFLPAMNIHYGFAGIEYGDSIQHADVAGGTTTALMGCACVSVDGGVWIECHVALYDRIYDPANVETFRKVIPVTFEGSKTGMLMQCDTLRITVQSVRFPHRQYDFMPTGFYGDRPAQKAPLLNCLVDPSKCNDVDAIIYVAPVCTLPREDGGSGGTLACIAKLKHNFCFPYCVGLHQRRLGSHPITLYSERTLSAGVYMANMDCSPPLQRDTATAAAANAAADAASPYESSTSTSTQEDLTDSTTISALAKGFGDCRASPTHNSLLRARVGCSGSGATAGDGTCLGAELLGIGVLYKADPTRFERVAFAALQPVVVAGDALLIPKCNPIPGGCEWTTSVMRLTSDVQGQYSIKPKLTRVPSIRTDAGSKDQKRVLVLPRETMDYKKWYNPAAQTETGIFYALNPDTRAFACAITRDACTQFTAQGQFLQTRVLFTEPSYQCTKDTSVKMPAGQQARLCSTNLTREVLFGVDDSFWSYDDDDRAKFADDMSERRVRNLFVEDVQYYNALNVVVAVRRGPVPDMLFENGERTPPPGYVSLSSTVFYFVNTATLEARRERVWSRRVGSTGETTYGMLCPSDSIMPPFASAAASFVAVLLKAAEIVVNQLVLNVVGVVEAAVSRRSEAGLLCMHGTQDHYAFFPCSPGPLSMRPVYTLFLRFHAKTLKCTKASLAYVSYLIDVPLSEYHWSQGAAYAFTPPNLEFTAAILRAFRFSLATGVSVTANAAVASFYGTVFVYEHVALPYAKRLLFMRYSGNVREDVLLVFYTLSNTVHEAVTSNAMDNTVLLPAEQSCLSLAMLTGDSARPLGQFVEHSCLAVFEGVKAALRLVPSVFTLTSITHCLCADSGPLLDWASVEDVTAACQLMIPPALHAEYFHLIHDYTSANQMNYRTKMCARLFDSMQTHVNDIPAVVFSHLRLAALASAGIPQQMVAVFNIPGLDSWSCGTWATDIGVITIVPQPVRVFTKCAYTRTCRATCEESIDWFQAERNSIAVATKPATTGRVRLGIPMWESTGRIFSPVLVQDYGSAHGCRRWIAVFAQTFTGEVGVGHEMLFLCQSLADMAIVVRQLAWTVQLPSLLDLGLDFGVHGFGDSPPDAQTVHEMWFAPLGPPDALTAVLVISATAPDNDAGLYEVRTARNGGLYSARWIVRAKSVVSVYTRCAGLLAASGLESIREPSAAYPAEFVKFVMAPPEREQAIAGGDYRMFGRLLGHGIDVDGLSARFNAVVEFVVEATGEEAKCRAAIYSPFDPSNLAAFFAYHMRQRNLYTDTRGRLLSIGKPLKSSDNSATASAAYTVEYHRIVTVERSATTDNMRFELALVQNFSADMSLRNYVFNVAVDRRRTYSRGHGMHAHPRTSAMLTVHEGDDVHAREPDSSTTRVFSVLESSPSRLPKTASWLVESTVSADSTARATAMRGALPAEAARGGKLQAARHVSISDAVLARVEHECDYMDCAGCSTLSLQRSCYQAQRCAIANCVGTPVNTNNVMCVLGGVAREIQEFTLADIHEGWMLGVELVMGVVRKWMLSDSSTINVQGLSSMMVTRMCGFKDILATLSAVIPSLYYTIFTGVLGGDPSTTAPVSRAYMLVQRSITPLQKLQTTELVTAITSLIFQFFVLAITVGYNYVRIMMCFVEQIVSFSSGHLNLVINDVGEEEGFCLGGGSSDRSDSGYSDSRGGGETDAQMLQRAVRDGTLSGHSARISYSESASISASEFMTTAAGMILWQRKLPKIMLIASLSSVIDWLIGLVYGIARITVAAQDPECNPTPRHMAGVVDCVCGDDAYDIAEFQAESDMHQGALWCVGVLRMVDATGMLVYVYNPRPLRSLATTLAVLMPLYLECISRTNSDECDTHRAAIDSIEPSQFKANAVTAINVLTQCRANYAAKTWDDGLFAVFNPEIRASVLAGGKISYADMGFIKKKVLDFLCGAHAGAAFVACEARGAVVECLRLGPEFNSIEHCMSLHFALETTRTALINMRIAGRYEAGVAQDPDLAATPQNMRTLNRMEYFSYEKRAAALPNTNADACAWASSPSIKADVKAQCDSSAQQCAHGKLTNPTKCALNMVQGTSSRSATSNPVSLFIVIEGDTVRSDADIVERYSAVRRCALSFMTPFLENIDKNKVLANIVYDVLSFEGDLVHRLLDCVVLGPLEQLDMLPSLDSAHIEQLTYSRDNADALLENGVACPIHTLTNTKQNVTVERASTVCGSGPRIAALSYIARDIYTEDAARSAITSLIMQRIASITQSVENIGMYGCQNPSGDDVNYAHCCPGGLESRGDCNFYPSSLDLRTTIPVSEIINEIHGSEQVDKLQFRAMFDSDMWTKYRTDEYSKSISEYAKMLPELRSNKVAYPVHGMLDESDLSYTFPFTRAPPHNLNMVQQCHALLRVKTFSAHFAEFEGDDDNEGMLTLPGIKQMLARGEQWRPLGADGLGETRAEMIHRLLASEELEDAFAGLYDARFVSLDSRFCPKNVTAGAGRTMPVTYGDLTKSTVAQTPDLTENLWMHGFAARSMGAAREGCPCFEVYVGGEPGGDLMCPVSLAICTLDRQKVLEHVPKFSWTDLCEQVHDEADTTAPLPIAQGAHVRAVLTQFSRALKANPMYSCPLFNVSDLWGVMPGTRNAMRAYLNGSPAEIPATPFISLLMHTRSGVTLSNIATVNRKIANVLGEGDRTVRLAGGADDPDTRVENVLCVDAESGHVDDHARVARLAFPAVSAVAESPVVVDCLRYIIEVSWLDMLEAIAGDELAGGDEHEGVARLRAQSAENIEVWRERCNIKLYKLDTCQHQAAYDVDMVRELSVDRHAERADGDSNDCPFTEDPTDPDIGIMHAECLVVVRGEPELYDVRQCPLATGAGVAGVTGVTVVTRAMLVEQCEVVHALQLLQQPDESALPDTPLLSERFVRRVIAATGLGSRSRTQGGVLGLRAGEDFLFPNKHEAAEAQCFPAVPYWPVAWQAPFGEVVSDSLQHATGFSNHMMLVCSSEEGDCNADGKARVVLMPDHLRVENMTSTLFGTGGFCREHSFAMPLVRTNTHAICTAVDSVTSDVDQSHTDDRLESARCSSTPRVSAGGGTGAVLGNMWPLLRNFVQVDPDAVDTQNSYSVSDDMMTSLLERIQAHPDDEEFAILPVLSTDEDMDIVVGTLCTATENYQESPTFDESREQEEVGCTQNRHCSKTSMRAVCNAAGVCVNITVEVTHEFPDADTVELGLSVPSSSGGCIANTLKPPPSPWEQYASFLEQHGMCSHSNAISYQRMLESMETHHVSAKNCRVTGMRYVCGADKLEWDWITQFPWSWRGNGAGDTSSLHKYTQTVEEAEAFQLEPHACDADYMHTRGVMHMCDLDARSASNGNVKHAHTHWMRHSDVTGEFTTMKTGDSATNCFAAARDGKFACASDNEAATPVADYTANKLRFMALGRDSVNFVGDDDTTALVQTCQEFGVCQREFFTFGGVHTPRHNDDKSVRTTTDTKECLSVGYVHKDSGAANDCVLDKHTAALAYVVMQDPGGSCAALYRPAAISSSNGILQYDAVSRTATYASRNSKRVVQLLNRIFWIHSDVRASRITRVLEPTGDDPEGRVLYQEINDCAVGIQAYLGALDASRTHKDMIGVKTSGLYYFYEYGTYEVPLLWWLKYGVQTVALDYNGGVAAPTADVVKMFELDAYDNRAREFNLQNMWNGNNAQSVPLKTLWARANTKIIVNAKRIGADVSAALSAKWSEKFSNREYELRCPLRVSLAMRTYTPPRSSSEASETPARVECPVAFENLAHALFSSDTGEHSTVFVDDSGSPHVPTLVGQFDHPIMGIASDLTCAHMYDAPRTPALTEVMGPSSVDQSFKLIYHVIEHLFKEGDDRIKVYDPFHGDFRDMMATSKDEQIPIATVTLSKKSLKEAVKQNIADIAADMLKSKQNSCKTDKAQTLVGRTQQSLPTKNKPCIFDRFKRASMKREGVARGWINHKQSADSTTAKIFNGDTSGEPAATIQMCARHTERQKREEKVLWGRQHPDRQDGMPCSIADVMEHGMEDTSPHTSDCTHGCGNTARDREGECHTCGRKSQYVKHVDIRDPIDTIEDRKCSLDDNSANVHGGPLGRDELPVLLEREGEYVYNADAYRQTIGRSPKRRRGVCHRIDSGCVTGHNAAKLSGLFAYNGQTLHDAGLSHPVQAAYERVNHHAYTQVSVPRLEEHAANAGRLSNAQIKGARVANPTDRTKIADLDDLGVWWKRDIPMHDIDGTSNPEYEASPTTHIHASRDSSRTGMQCNVRKITAPGAGVVLDAFQLNKDELPDADVAHLLYNDRLAFTRHDGRQLLFGHHFPKNGNARDESMQNTMGAPPWSFCETDAQADTDGEIHWFRVAEFGNTDKRVASNLYRWDQRTGFESTSTGIAKDTSTFKCRDALVGGRETFYKKQTEIPGCTRPNSDTALYKGYSDQRTDGRIVCSYRDFSAYPDGCDGLVEPEKTTCTHTTSVDHRQCGGGVCCGTYTYDPDILGAMQQNYCLGGQASFDKTGVGTCEVPRVSDYGPTETCKCYQEPVSFAEDRKHWARADLNEEDKLLKFSSAVNIFKQTFEPHGTVVNKASYEKIPRFDKHRTTLISDKFAGTTIFTGGPQPAETVPENDVPRHICTKGSGPMLLNPISEYEDPYAGLSRQSAQRGTTYRAVWRPAVAPDCRGFNGKDVPTHQSPPEGVEMDASTCSRIPDPANQDGFDVFDLAVCWEQDVYETANIRPWWSLSIGEMMMNFMDRSTSRHAYTHWLKFAIPEKFTMRDFLYPYYTLPTTAIGDDFCWMGRGAPGQKFLTDEDVPYRYCDIRQQTRAHKHVELTDPVFLPIKPATELFGRDFLWGLFGVDLLRIYSAGWVNMVAVVEQSVFTAFHQTLAQGADTPPINKILGRHLWLFKDTYRGKTATHPLRFAPCIPDFTQNDINDLTDNGYRHLFPAAQLWDTRGYLKFGGDKKRYITKPTQWAELDGSPGSLLVACHPDCVVDKNSPANALRKKNPDDNKDPLKCDECRPLLVKTTATSEMEDEQERKIWTADTNAGACAYSLVLENKHYCSSFRKHVFDDGESDCPPEGHLCSKRANCVSGTQSSFYPIAGQDVSDADANTDTSDDTGAIFKCGGCLQYDADFPVLHNTQGVDGGAFDHCVGCGLYLTTSEARAPMKGPYSRHTIDEVAEDLMYRIDELFRAPKDLAESIEEQLKMRASGDSDSHTIDVNVDITLDPPGTTSTPANPEESDITITINMMVSQGDLVKIDTEITKQFELFGTNENEVAAGCTVDKRPSETKMGTEMCEFRVGFNSIESGAFDGAYQRRMMIKQNCVESQQARDLQGEYTCTPDVLANTHMERLREFAQETLRETYGMEVPTVEFDETRTLSVAGSMDFNWGSGVLPFYTAANRGRGVFVKSLLDINATCRDEYDNNINILTRPCIKKRDNTISVVNPWLGGNYSFYKTGYGETFGSEESKVLAGFDMCEIPDAVRTDVDITPCAARACLARSATDSNTSVCGFSTGTSAPTRLELPPLDTQYKIARVNTPTYVYTPRPAHNTCDRQFKRGQRGHAACSLFGHMQAPIGYAPNDIVHGTTPSAPGPTLVAARLFRDVFWVSLPGAGPLGTGLTDSLWAGGNTRTYLKARGDVSEAIAAGTEGATYALLAVRASQLAPDYVRLTINGYGILAVSEVGLRAGRSSYGTMPPIPHKLWTRNAAHAVRHDNELIDANPVYNTTCVAGSACSPQHWACVYVKNALFGASGTLRRRHSRLRLMTPDPPRMQRLFGSSEGLGRAHPLVSVRDIELSEMHEYAQIGHTLFVRRDGASEAKQKAVTHVNQAIRHTAFAFTTATEIVHGDTAMNNPNRMDWPWVRMDLRSGESMRGQTTVANSSVLRHDKSKRMTSFKIWVSTKGTIQHETHPPTPAGQPAEVPRTPRSTLDRGGDCHREYIPRVTEALLDDLKGFEKCYVESSTHSLRTLRCENAIGAANGLMSQRFTLNTTRPHTRTLAQLHAAGPRFLQYQACSAHAEVVARSPNTSLYAGVLREEHTVPAGDAELSLSRRQRISPLWSLIEQRTRVARTVHELFSGTAGAPHPRELWDQSAARRAANPRWHSDTAAANRSGARAQGLSKMVGKTESATCAGLAESVAAAFGDDAWSAAQRSQRDRHCLAVIDHIDRYKREQACDETAVSSHDFDICSLTDLQPLCASIAQFSAQVAGVNAWALRQTEHTAMLYTPSVFMRGDGIFAWHAVASSYDEFEFVGPGRAACPDINMMYSTAAAEGSLESGACPGRAMVSIVKMLNQLRGFVVTVVQLMSDMFNLVFEFAIGVVYSMMPTAEGDHAGAAQVSAAAAAAFQKCFALLADLLTQFVMLFFQLMQLIMRWIAESPIAPLIDVIEVLCIAVKIVGSIVLSLIILVAKAIALIPGLSDFIPVDELETMLSDLQNAPCKMIVDECGGASAEDCAAVDDATSLVASFCGIENFGENGPTDVFNGYLSEYQCLGNSHCLVDGTSGFATLCAKCPTPAESTARASYKCDMATKMCMCGPPERTVSRCYTNLDCKLAGATCSVKGNVHSLSMGTEECIGARGASFCYRDSVESAVGDCTLFSGVGMDSAAGCFARQLGTPVHNARTGVCLGTHNYMGTASAVEEHALFLYECSNNYMLTDSVRCMSVATAETDAVTYKAVWAPLTPGGGRRRLLDASGSAGGGAVLEFLRIAAPRLDAAPETCACKAPLRGCLDSGTMSAECKLCAAHWLFWNITLGPATRADTDMLDVREAVVHLILAPALAGAAVLRAPHALLVLFEDWLHNAAAFRRVLEYVRAASAAVARFRDTHTAQVQALVRGSVVPHVRGGVVPHVAQGGGRTLLAAETHVVFVPDAKHPDISNVAFMYAPVARKRATLLYDTGVLELPAGLNCIVMGSVLVNNILYHVIKSFEREGWTAKNICDGDSTFVMTCPLLNGAVGHVINSTRVLVEYYMYMAYQTPCMTNMFASCLPPPVYSFKLVSEAFPRIRTRALVPQPARSAVETPADDIIINGALAGLRYVLNLLTVSKDSIESAFLGFMSLDPMYDDKLYASMRANNEFSLGSIARDFVACDLDETLSCRSRNSPLLVVSVSTFFLIGLAVVLLPIPSVFVFFLWTFGMTLGVVYLAYGFSPLCAPRIPVCLGEGLFDIVHRYILPEQLVLSHYLYDASVCDASLTRLPSAPTGAGPCLRSCVAAPISVDRVASVLVALDCAVFQNKAVVTRYVEALLPGFVRDVYDTDAFAVTIHHFEAIFMGDDEALKSGVHVCIMVNLFKLILAVCVLIILIPICFYALQLVLNIAATVIVKTLSLVLQLGQSLNGNML